MRRVRWGACINSGIIGGIIVFVVLAFYAQHRWREEMKERRRIGRELLRLDEDQRPDIVGE